MRTLMKTAVAALALTVAGGAASAENIAIVGGKVHTMDRAGVIENGTVLIADGKIRAVGADLEVPDGYRRVDASGKWVTPGVMNAYTGLGVWEVDQENSTRDDRSSNGGFSAAFDISYGFNPRASTIPITRIEGVTRAAVNPTLGDSIFGGQGAVVSLGNGEDALTDPRAFMYVAVGESGKGRAGGSRGGTMVALIHAIEEAARYRDTRNREEWDSMLSRLDAEALIPVTTGEMPLVIYANRASDLTQLIDLANRYRKLDIVVMGAAEGWMVAEDLAEAEIPVILYPFYNLPRRFESLGATQANAARLVNAGVLVAIADTPDGDGTHNPRLVLQYAGNAVANGLSWDEAMKAITVNPARIYGIADRYGSLTPGKDADVVVWNGDPLEVMTSPDMVVIQGKEVPLESRQTRLRDRYLDLNGNNPFAYRR